MTIVMEEDGFSSSLSSLSCLTPQQSNYQTLSSNGIHNTSQQNSSSNSPNSSADYTGPYALFLFRSSSSLELFEERRISLDKPCKIGRSVAKIKPEPNNAIFDCKVLSRNHALLWHENSKFFIQDTKSSNGTFLNGNRLGKSNEDSAPFELTSGDIIQFGVDVTENTKKVTHGCITVELKLFFKPGVEATNKTNQSNQSNKIDVQTQEIYQLALFLQEAMMREEILNQKLNSLQKFIDQAKETSENGWLTLIDEDRLLSRIDYLEKQSVLHTKNFSDDSLKKCITNLSNEKFNVENSAKLTIEKMIEEKNVNAQLLDELNTTVTLRNDECVQLQNMLEDSKKNIIDLASKYQELLNELEELKQSSSESKIKMSEKLNQTESEKQKFEQLYEESIEKEKALNAKIESLIADKDFTSKRLEGILNKLEKDKSDQLNVNDKQKPSDHDLKLVNGIDHNQKDDINPYDFDGVEECNGFHHLQEESVHLVTATNKNNSLKDEAYESEPIFKEEPTEENVSFSRVEIDSAVENIIQKIEKQTSVPEQKQANENESSELNLKFKNENELLNKQLENQKKINSQLTNEIETLKSLVSDSSTSNKTNLNVSQQTDDDNQHKKNANLNTVIQTLKEQFDIIKNIITENETNNIDSSTNNPNDKLLELFNYLDDSYKRIDEIKNKINPKQIDSELIQDDKQDESDNSKLKCSNLDESLEDKIKEIEQDYEKRLNVSEQKLEQINIEYDNLSLQTKIVSYCSTIPLLILIFAIMIAFYPTLSTITATGL